MASIRTEAFGTCEGRAVFVNVWEPNNKGKYSVGIAFPKMSSDITVITNAIQEIQGMGFNKTPLKDCDTEPGEDGQTRAAKYPFLAGCYLMDFTTQYQPRVIGPDHLDVVDKGMLYAGCWVRLVGHAYGWHSQENGRKGVSLGLDLVQVVPANGRPCDSTKTTMDYSSVLGAPGAPLPATGQVQPQYGQSQAPQQAPVYQQPQAPQQAPVYQQPQAPQQAPTQQAPTQQPAYPQQPINLGNVFDQ